MTTPPLESPGILSLAWRRLKVSQIGLPAFIIAMALVTGSSSPASCPARICSTLAASSRR